MFRVDKLRTEDRPGLCRMLEQSDDFPQQLLYLNRRTHNDYETFVAWEAGEIVGMLSGSFNSDLTQSGGFDSFDLPTFPHAFLDRIHVRDTVRGTGVGRALIHDYSTRAYAHGCTFIGVSIDLSSDPSRRAAFFQDRGFSIREYDNFGALTRDVLAAGTTR